MANTFGPTSTTDEVLASIDLRGKRALVTGVSSGLGIETARVLAAHGAQVVGTARNLAKAEAATAEVRAAAQAAGGSFSLVELDLASLASVRQAADQLVEQGQPFDIVIANAGVMATPLGRTADGFEMQFGTNHLGHFLLINRIASLIADKGRFVSVSSGGHRTANVDLVDPNFLTTEYDRWAAYGRSKTANILFAREFDRRHRGRGIHATSVMPGVANTGLGQHMSMDDTIALGAMIDSARKEAGLPPFQFKTVPQAAATTIWAAAIADGATVAGQYCEDCQVAEVDDGAGFRGGVMSYALDDDTAAKLWTLSEDLVGERF
jgi:NAD(P)-dependent dehydrogenase (short-subunit alcohol dehydrogenase family)